MNERELHAYLAAIVDSSDDAIISKDLQGIVQSFNSAAEQMFGYSASEIIGKSILILIPPDRHAEEAEILRRLRRGERIDHFETVRVTKSGQMLDISLTVSPVRDGNGKIVGASKIARNITEKKRTAAALIEQQEWFRITLNSIGDAVIACDGEGLVTFLNREAQRLTGWPLADAQGQPLSEVFHIVNETSRKLVDNPAATVLRTGDAVDLANHTLLIARDGTEWPIADKAAPIVGEGARTIGVVIIFREIVELQKSAERARFVALERERLLQSERAARTEAERANRVKDEFVALVSHELRTPLNAILGWTEVLKSGDPELLEQGIEVIARNTRLQAQLISDLLDVSRIVAGKLRLEYDRVDLVRIIQNSIEALQSMIADKGVELEVMWEKSPILVLGDWARLQQIALNLLSNAVKFTPKGGKIEVLLRLVDEQAEISVTDTGVGIRPEFLPHVFERFRQDALMTTRRHGGLGLGLAITKHLVEMHGGSVRAWSPGEGKGATFSVELPLITPDSLKSLPGEALESADAESREGGSSLQGIRVLVVEDDRDTRDLLDRLLTAHGAESFVAASAGEALELLEDVRPTVLVSDIGLPDVDGYELIDRLRHRSDSLAHIPAIALTAFARPEDRTRALRAGFNAHVAKPVEPMELVATVGGFKNLVVGEAGR